MGSRSVDQAGGPRASRAVLVAIGLTAAVLLEYQIVATRILSATTSYEVSFAILALVMLGLAASGTRLYIDRKKQSEDAGRTTRALLFGAASLVVGMLLVVGVSHLPLSHLNHARASSFLALVAFYPPFYFAGYAIASILTDYATDVGRVYWADLIGAALGALAVVPLLSLVTPIQAGLLSATALSVAAWLISDAERRRSAMIGTVVTLLIAIVGVAVPQTTELLRGKFADREPIWASWNHLSRVTVYDSYGPTSRDMPEEELRKLYQRAAIAWGLSEKYEGEFPDQRRILLDYGAATSIVGGGHEANLEALRWDVTSLGHHAKGPDLDSVFIIGGGGGRDILTALEFDAKEVDVVELNPDVVRAVQEDLADFTNKPYTAPGVNLTIGDARSELSRRDKRYDLIQMSMIDTFASSSSGALALTENVLYTREAFDTYRDHLADGGILSVTRWYTPHGYGEVPRLLQLVGDSLRRGGVDNPDKHVVIATNLWMAEAYVSTALMKTTPFTPEELERIAQAREQLGFSQMWPPVDGHTSEIDVPAMLRGEAPKHARMWLELETPTDDFPFFFNMQRPFMSIVGAVRDGTWDQVSYASKVLLGLLLIAALWSWMVVIRPLRAEGEEMGSFGTGPRIYFAGLGLGFLFVELALIQRLTIYLGHPTYALTVVLASLLLFGGIGSFLSQRIDSTRGMQHGAVAVILTIGFAATIVPFLLGQTGAWSLIGRQALAVVCIIPVGLALGLMYPSGVRQLATTDRQAAVPWAWAINGVCGVVATVLGMLIAMTVGYRALLLCAGLIYAAVWWGARNFDAAA